MMRLVVLHDGAETQTDTVVTSGIRMQVCIVHSVLLACFLI